MTILNRAWSAAAAVAAAGIDARPASAWCVTAQRIGLLLLMGLLIAGTACGNSVPAYANSNSTGTTGMGSSGRLAAAPMNGSRRIGSLHTRRFHFRRGDVAALERARAFRRFHHRDRDEFVGGFFPFGFFPGAGWPVPEPDLAAADQRDEMDWRSPVFWLPAERYEPPTVEKAPSGVTIIRGPGSHHVWP